MSTPISELLAEKIRTLLHERKWDQKDLAERSGLKQPVISRLLNGKSDNPQIKTLEAIAKAFGVTVYSLLIDRKSPPTLGLGGALAILDHLSKALGEKIKYHNLTQEQAGVILGVTRSCISSVVKGAELLSLESTVRMVRFFNIRIDDALSWEQLTDIITDDYQAHTREPRDPT